MLKDSKFWIVNSYFLFIHVHSAPQFLRLDESGCKKNGQNEQTKNT